MTLWVGRVLSEIRISEVSLVLSFWEHDDDLSAWLYAEEINVAATGGDDGERSTLRRSSSNVLLALHALLNRRVAEVDGLDGRLRNGFEGGVEVLVEPQAHNQAWALSFEQGGSITCGPGGLLNVRLA